MRQTPPLGGYHIPFLYLRAHPFFIMNMNLLHSVSCKFFEICDNFNVLLVSPDNCVSSIRTSQASRQVQSPTHIQTSLVAQTAKNPPAMWETWVQPPSWEGPLEEGMATHSIILAWRIPKNRGSS